MKRISVRSSRIVALSLMLGLSAVVLSLVLARPPATRAATTITVTSDADAGGTCPGSSCTLRQAIATASPGDTIKFAPGLTTVNLTTAELLIYKNLTISGPGANLLTVQRSFFGPQIPNFRIFHIASGNFNVNVTISGLTITNGNFPGGAGGGIFNESTGTLTVTGCAISANSASDSGGGIFNMGALTTISDSTISANSATFGGGIYNYGSATTTITNSTFSGNSASNAQGGGRGGGIYNNGTVTITNSTLSGNSANPAGGGGGIINFGTVNLTNCTIAGNSAGYGGGIENGGTVKARNTIIAKNTALVAGPDFNYTLTSQGFNLIGNNSGTSITTGTTGTTTGNQLNVDPLLGPLQDNGGPTFTHALLPGSPAINEGDPNFTPPPSYDQRGPNFYRVRDLNIDIGSFEVQAGIGPRQRPTPHPRPTPPR